MNEKPKILKIAINSPNRMKLFENFFVTQQYIDPSVFKIV